MKSKRAIRLKICGMRFPDNILEIGALSPDYMGFIFFRGSKRYAGDDFVIPNELPDVIKKVGVFVDESTSEIMRIVSKHGLDLVQLHGDETVEQCAQLKSSGMILIKAFAVNQDFDFSIVDRFKGVVDFFLFDTKGTSHGGNGFAFDWDLLKSYDQKRPFFLSGGISPENIENLTQLSGMNIHAIDVNSRIEKAVGIKDRDLVRKIKERIGTLNINELTN